MGVPKLLKLELSWLCKAISLCADLQSWWGLKQSYNPRQDLSNYVLHVTCTQGNRVDSRLLVVRSQSVNLAPNLSFDHNLCFRCPNGSCESILNIYVSISFQWYKEFLNVMGFDLCNHFLKIREFTGTLLIKMGTHLGMWVYILTLSHNHVLPSWATPLQAFALVVSSRLGLWQ
jgi:hypothetical protein